METNLPLPCPTSGADELISRPTDGVLRTLSKLEGELLILGVGGKMGPTLAMMAQRSFKQLGKNNRVIGVSRFSNSELKGQLDDHRIETIECDLLNRTSVQSLPNCPNVIFLAGQKFGTDSVPETTWAANTVSPAYVAEKFAGSRIVVLSTGCVYPFAAVNQGGSVEGDPLEPTGEYPNSCVGRERLFGYFSKLNQTPLAIIRLFYAIDLRYGVLLDMAQKILSDEAINVTTGHLNVIWQGDAIARTIQSLEHAACPPFVINLTGPETISVRYLAARFGELFGRRPKLVGTEAETAWLGNAGKAQRLFGYPTVSLEQMILWVAAWLQAGGETWGKPTHFESRDGRF